MQVWKEDPIGSPLGDHLIYTLVCSQENEGKMCFFKKALWYKTFYRNKTFNCVLTNYERLCQSQCF